MSVVLKEGCLLALVATNQTVSSQLQIYALVLCPVMLGLRLYSTDGTPHMSAGFLPVLPMGCKREMESRRKDSLFLFIHCCGWCGLDVSCLPGRGGWSYSPVSSGTPRTSPTKPIFKGHHRMDSAPSSEIWVHTAGPLFWVPEDFQDTFFSNGFNPPHEGSQIHISFPYLSPTLSCYLRRHPPEISNPWCLNLNLTLVPSLPVGRSLGSFPPPPSSTASLPVQAIHTLGFLRSVPSFPAPLKSP